MSGLFYSPIQYDAAPIDDVTDAMPDDAWVASAFSKFVRGEFRERGSRGPMPSRLEPASMKVTSSDIAYSYMEHCEKSLVYSGFLDGLLRSNAGDTAEQLYALLTHASLGDITNRKNLALTSFRADLEPLLARKVRLHFLVPSFPFKDQNIFRVNAPASHVDLADIALLIRLHILSLAMFQCHPYGADWVLVSDGPAYAEIFGVSQSDTMSYRKRLLEARQFLNIHGSISIIDLQEMTQRLRSRGNGTQIFAKTVEHLQARIEGMSRATSGDIRNEFRVLVRGMKWNLNLKDLGCEWTEEWWSILDVDEPTGLAASALKLWTETEHRANVAATKYAAFNLALRYHGVFKRFIPDGLRATIHPKHGELAVPQLGSVFPWNGVPVVEPLPIRHDSLSIDPLLRIKLRGRRLQPYIRDRDQAPFYYALE